jgi:Tfp pilus assembly protein PilN
MQVSDQLKDHAATLEDLQNSLATQSHQLAELNERLDFAEHCWPKAGTAPR